VDSTIPVVVVITIATERVRVVVEGSKERRHAASPDREQKPDSRASTSLGSGRPTFPPKSVSKSRTFGGFSVPRNALREPLVPRARLDFDSAGRDSPLARWRRQDSAQHVLRESDAVEGADDWVTAATSIAERAARDPAVLSGAIRTLFGATSLGGVGVIRTVVAAVGHGLRRGVGDLVERRAMPSVGRKSWFAADVA
jgi:hypothetical protein